MSKIVSLYKYLKSKKTYICAIGIGITGFLYAAGYLNKEAFDYINAALYPATAAAIRHDLTVKE
jgi:hypothetical protein